MYLSRIRLANWRSYADCTFKFLQPSPRRPLVLIGAMNGHGKTSLLVSLYLGLFGRFGLKYCEGFDAFAADGEKQFYRKAISQFRRHGADPGEPTVIELCFSPTLRDTNSDSEEVRITRSWFFNGNNQPRPTDSFETVQLFVGDEALRCDLDSAPLRVEKHLFPAHVMPAFFFDGEQAQRLIMNSGEDGIRKAVEVMFGTKLIEEVHEQIKSYLVICHNKMGGKKNSSQKERELSDKCRQREDFNRRIANLQKDEGLYQSQKEELETKRREAQERMAKLGGEGARDIEAIHAAADRAQRDKALAERAVTDSAKSIGLALAVSRLATPIRNRLNAEETRESWERLREGTILRADEVLAAAMPEPPSADELLGHLNSVLRDQVRERFRKALVQIYNPPPQGCADEYRFGHCKGEARSSTIDLLSRVRSHGSQGIRAAARELKRARDEYEDAHARLARIANLPSEVSVLHDQIQECTKQIEECINRLASIESEIRQLKGDLQSLNAQIGKLQEEVAAMEPEQRRIAVAERVHRVLDDLTHRLKPIALEHLQGVVTKHFLSIADSRFKGGRILFPSEEAPLFEWKRGGAQRIDTMSGFERRSFGIAFSLALAEITQRRVPLVIDTPLGNADSEYRPRLLDGLKNVDLDQIVILTHDEEVTPDLLSQIEGQVSQKFLVRYDDQRRESIVYSSAFFGDIK